ncbi:hypothetical protein SL103_07455 [Streptomyces lydicus]|uniref:Uncharacterized protein n=1 Tax=Streptomyces lydicus TaxID=47763 RepID=A0A1D7VH95_9ACTN|nr:hypothetical protein SL103_07455 [Streptomyces lydicus]
MVHTDDQYQLIRGGSLSQFTDQVCGQVLRIVDQKNLAMWMRGKVRRPLPRATVTGLISQSQRLIAVFDEIAQSLVSGN